MSDDATPSSPTRAPTSTRRAVLNTIKGSAGNLVEWYDVYIYTVFATYFEAQFFDKNDTNSTLYIYAIFAVTFVMRPVGSWFFGRFADRRGRRAALMLSITFMSACSFVVAVMPTREIIGYWAAVILVARPAGAGLRHGRRVRHLGDLHVRSGDREPARLLLVVPVRHARRRPRARAVHAADRAQRPGRRGVAATGDGGSASSSAASPRWWCCGSAARWTSR